MDLLPDKYKNYASMEAALTDAKTQNRLLHDVSMIDYVWDDSQAYDAMIMYCMQFHGPDAIVPIMADGNGLPVWPLRYPYDHSGIWTHNIGVFYFDTEEDAVVFRLKFS